ncbi:MAG: HK97 family phage prohead protease [Sphingomonadaceae bacterium]|nr:HK97 family phage prohead protease [Sphingomonadaceae bacterium]
MSARIAGYAAVWDHPDHGRDVIRRGAFARAPRGGLPLLWQHDAKRPIGRIESVGEDQRGLRVIGRIADGSAAGHEAMALVKAGALTGLSFGYRVRRARDRPPGRELLDLELLEVSLVTFPMQPRARVLGWEGS